MPIVETEAFFCGDCNDLVQAGEVWTRATVWYNGTISTTTKRGYFCPRCAERRIKNKEEEI